jgi:dipeptidase E
MKLLLTSQGITNKTLEIALLQLLGKPFEQAHITFIPTAANIDKGDKSWLVSDMNNLKKLRFPTFEITDIAIMSKTVWLPSFEKADLLVFGGGTAPYLMEWLEKSEAASILPKLLQTKVYMGISAGSMVTAKHISMSSQNILNYEQTGDFKPTNGLGLVDFEIRPHLNSAAYPKVRLEYLETLSKENHATFYALDDQTAVQVVDDAVTVVTEGKWRKFN